MPLIGPMLLLIFENVSAYALIQDYALIRTLRVPSERYTALRFLFSMHSTYFLRENNCVTFS